MSSAASSTQSPLSSNPRGPRRPRRRAWLIALIVVLVLLAAGVLLAPTIAGAVAPSLVDAQARERINGKLTLGSVHLSWFGPQRVTGVEIVDDHGAPVFKGDAEATTSLARLLFGSRDLGTLTLRGRADLVGDEQGHIKVIRETPKSGATAPTTAPTPTDGGSAKPSRLPRDLKATIVLDGLTITYTDPGVQARFGAPVGIKDLSGSAAFAVGSPLVVSLKGATFDGAGGLSVDATATGLTDSSGALTPDTAAATAKIRASAAPAYLDALSGAGGLVSQAAKGLVTLSVDAQGDSKAGSAALKMDVVGAPDTRADVQLEYSAGRVRLAKPAVLSASITQGLLDRLAKQPAMVTIERPVGLTVTIDALEAAIAGLRGSPLDLRGGVVKGRVETTEAAGSIALAPSEKGEAFRVAPASFTLSAPDLAGPVALAGKTSATYAGQSAGEFSIDLTADGLLDAHGAPRPGLPPTLRGSAAVKGAATALAQPFVERFGLDMSRDVGPTLDASVVAMTKGEAGAAAGAIPTTDLTLSLKSRAITGRGQLLVDSERIRTQGDGVVLRTTSSGPLLGRLLAASGVKVAGEGTATLTVTGLDVPRGASGMRLDQAAGKFEIESEGLTVWPKADATSIEGTSTRIVATLAPGAPPALELRADLSSEGKPFTAQADLKAPGLFGADGSVNSATVKPEGTAKFVGMPTSLAGIFLASRDDVELVRQAVGKTIDLSLTAQPDGAATRAQVEMKGDGGAAQATMVATPGKSVAVSHAGVTAVVSPELADAAVRRFAPTLKPAPRLAGKARLDLTIADFSVPIGADWKPDLAKAQPVDATLLLADDLVVRGIPIASASDSKDTTGKQAIDLGLRKLIAKAHVGLGDAGPREATITGAFFDPASPELTVAALKADASISGGRTVASARFENVNSAAIDALLGRPGLLDLSIGSPATLTAKVNRGTEADPMLLEAGVDAPRLKTGAKAQVMSDRVMLTQPMDIQWTMDEHWAARYLTPSQGDVPATVRIVGPTTFNLSLRKAVAALGPGPMKPGVFAIDARAGAPSLTLATRDGVNIAYKDVLMDLVSGNAPGSLSLQASANGGDSGSFKLTGDATNLADSAGVLTTDKATISMKADGSLPGALIDTLAGGRGRIAEALGEMVKIEANAQNLSRTGGTLSAKATSPRANATLSGVVKDGAFHTDGSTRAELSVITPELGELAFKQIMPLIGTIEKTAQDGPAIIEATDLIAPTDGDLSKLSGNVTINLGKVHYKAADFFGELIEATNNKTDAMLFGNWDPLEITIEKGIATYDRASFPIGKYNFETKGTVDLVKKQADIITYVPIVALVEKVAKIADKVPSVTKDTMLPLRTRGKFGSLKTEPALELLLKDKAQNPGDLVTDIFKQIQSDKDKKNEKKKADQQKKKGG